MYRSVYHTVMPTKNRRQLVIDPDVAERLKVEAEKRGQSMSRLVNEALREMLWPAGFTEAEQERKNGR